jgi:hypothetical protein
LKKQKQKKKQKKKAKKRKITNLEKEDKVILEMERSHAWGGGRLIKRSITPNRSPGGAQVDHQSDGSAFADRITRLICHRYIRHHRPRILLGDLAQDVLQHRECR